MRSILVLFWRKDKVEKGLVMFNATSDTTKSTREKKKADTTRKLHYWSGDLDSSHLRDLLVTNSIWRFLHYNRMTCWHGIGYCFFFGWRLQLRFGVNGEREWEQFLHCVVVCGLFLTNSFLLWWALCGPGRHFCFPGKFKGNRYFGLRKWNRANY